MLPLPDTAGADPAKKIRLLLNTTFYDMTTIIASKVLLYVIESWHGGNKHGCR